MSPTLSPIDAGIPSINSNDGYEETINQKISKLSFINQVNNNSKIIITNIESQYKDKELIFINDNIQQLQCFEPASCQRSNITFTNNNICNIECFGAVSCQDSQIIIINVGIHKLYVHHQYLIMIHEGTLIIGHQII